MGHSHLGRGDQDAAYHSGLGSSIERRQEHPVGHSYRRNFQSFPEVIALNIYDRKQVA